MNTLSISLKVIFKCLHESYKINCIICYQENSKVLKIRNLEDKFPDHNLIKMKIKRKQNANTWKILNFTSNMLDRENT